MLTEAPPKDRNRAVFAESDKMNTLDLPDSDVLPTIAKSIEAAMQTGKAADVRRPCAEFLEHTAAFYKVPPCGIRVLAARPLRADPG